MSAEPLRAVDRIVASIQRLSSALGRPVMVAIDGPSGSGKSMMASLIAEQTEAVVVPVDDFFSAEITDSEWNKRTPEERARDAINWRRLRIEALAPLLAGNRARWHPFDFAAGALPDGTYPLSDHLEIRETAPVVILDGAYSARPELTELLDLCVFVDAPADVRRRRLTEREEPGFLAKWYRRWDEAETWYLSRVRPKSSFDFVIRNG